MSAFCFTILCAPRASATVTTAGSASGMAATARLMAVSAMSATGSPRSTPTRNIAAHSTITAAAITRPKRASRFCNGVFTSSPPSSAAMRPISVCMPVTTTSPVPRP